MNKFDDLVASELLSRVGSTPEQQLAEQLRLALAEVRRLTAILAQPMHEFFQQTSQTIADLQAEIARLAISERVADAADALRELGELPLIEWSRSATTPAARFQRDLHQALVEWRKLRDREIVQTLRGSQKKL